MIEQCQLIDNETITSICNSFQNFAESNSFQDYGILGLFLNSLLSGTALPLPTEILTIALLEGGESEILIIIALTTGGIIAGLLNYGIGYGGNKVFRIFKKAKPDSKEKKSHTILEKFSWAAIFFSPFILVIGDLLLIGAGSKRMDFKRYLLFMITGKLTKSIVTVLGLGVVFN